MPLLPLFLKLGSRDNDSKKVLEKVYHELYFQSIKVLTLFKKLSTVAVGGERYGSRLASRIDNYSRVMSLDVCMDVSIPEMQDLV